MKVYFWFISLFFVSHILNAGSFEEQIKRQQQEIAILSARYGVISQHYVGLQQELGNYIDLVAQERADRRERDAMFDLMVKEFKVPSQDDSLWDTRSDGWFELKEKIKQKYFENDYHKKNNCGVARVACYMPEKIDPQKKKILVTAIHGSFAGPQSLCGDEKLSCKALKHYVKQRGEEAKAPVVFLVFRWSGENSPEARILGGESYSKIVTRYFSYPTWDDTHIAHSHGGAVLIWALRSIVSPANRAIFLAVPPREDDERYVPVAIKKLLTFWSDTDSVQSLGSLNDSSWWSLLSSPFMAGSSRKFNPENQQVDICNIRTLFDGGGPGHSQIKNTLWKLHDIEKKIETNYPYQADLQVNIVTDKNHRILLAIRWEILKRGVKKESPEVARKLEIASKASTGNKQKFKELYGYDFDAKSNILTRAVVGLNYQHNRPGDALMLDSYATDDALQDIGCLFQSYDSTSEDDNEKPAD